MNQRSLFIAILLLTLLLPITAHAAPIAPSISITITPDKLNPANAGYIYIGGVYPLNVKATLDDQPLNVFWSGDGYMALFAFDFDQPAGDHTIAVTADNPETGEHAEKTQIVTVQAYSYPLESVALPSKLIPLLDKDLNIHEVDHLNTIYAGRTNLGGWDWPFNFPVPGGIVTSRFGGDRTYNGGMWHAHHTGMDFRRSIGEPVYAAAAGRVAVAELFDVRGNLIIIDHGQGVFSQYAHLSEFDVQPGDWVARGQLIGLAGATGRTNGPHLHFEVIVNSITVDPLKLLALIPNFVPPREVNPSTISSGG